MCRLGSNGYVSAETPSQTKTRSNRSSNASESTLLRTSEASMGSKNDKFVNNNNVLEKGKKTERAWVISVTTRLKGSTFDVLSLAESIKFRQS